MVVISTHSVFAKSLSEKECVSIDLADQFGRVRNQGGSSTCVLQVAADLIGYSQKLSSDEQISAIDVGVNFATAPIKKIKDEIKKIDVPEVQERMDQLVQTMEKDRLKNREKDPAERIQEAGSAERAIFSYNVRGGYCTETQLPSQTWDSAKINPDFLPEKMESLAKREPVQTEGNTGCQKCSAKLEKIPADKFAPQNAKVFDEALLRIDSKIEKICSPRKALAPVTVENIPFKSGPQGDGARTIAENLRQRQPVGIGYNSTFLEKGIVQGHTANHTSIVVGMKWDATKKTCLMKIRNSFGESCEPYHPSIRKDCDKGNIWVSEETLNKTLEELLIVLSSKRN